MKKLTAIIFIPLMIISCSKSRLDLQNPNQLTKETFWKTKADVIAALAATYNLFRSANSGYWGVRGVEMSNGRGDDFFIRNDVKDLYQFSTFTNTADNGTVNNFWRGCYQGIFRANQVLENVDTVEMEDAERKAIIGEAKFLRGLNYFMLVINFGDVPLRLSVPPPQTTDYSIPKSPEEEVWKQVFKDFSEAAEALPVEYPEEWVGRATQGAAIGFLGKAYLYHKDWAKAEAAFNRLMKAPFSYDLVPNYAYNFDLSHENNIESVFEIQVGDVGGSSPWSTGAGESLGVTTAQEFGPAQVKGWFEAYPTDKVLNEFKKEKTKDDDFDPRMYATLVWEGQEGTFYQKPISSFFPTEFKFKSRFKKYQNHNQVDELKGSKGGDYSSSINERALRFADILLMHAEAVTMQGRPQEAYADLKRIRDRANLKELPAGYNQQQMMTEIQHQRMIEFCREGFRFYDLRRWGLLEQEIKSSDKIGREFLMVKKHSYFPIPQAELDANPKMIQNPNW
jgi:hypothetical protein